MKTKKERREKGEGRRRRRTSNSQQPISMNRIGTSAAPKKIPNPKSQIPKKSQNPNPKSGARGSLAIDGRRGGFQETAGRDSAVPLKERRLVFGHKWQYAPAPETFDYIRIPAR